jgi:protein-tyrosine-phosphatase
MSARPRLLFVCAGNTGRSLCAETLTRLHLHERGLEAEVFSRGLAVNPSHRRAEGPLQALWAERGIDVSDHLAQGLDRGDVEAADLILCATRAQSDEIRARHPTARFKTFALAEYAGVGGDLEDAFGKPTIAYRAMLTQLERQVPLTVQRVFAEFQLRPR